MLVIIYETMMAVRHFDLFFILTEGGPADASHVVAWEVYVETFRRLSFGTGAALAYIIALVTFLLAFAIIRTMGRNL
jgi:multiple sugar transport system permease protein